ncbi:hypothetical protein [Streptomyces sp. NBC_00670]|jgi:hypothetical protein|uniref:hypothetical protein n=1 Tax=Streptomyces sp. NBC_00670 TaxID=2975804 RepID=UPI002E36B93D|nr:hypothetical protein [Streptomyces sp. NBC_00670]
MRHFVRVALVGGVAAVVSVACPQLLPLLAAVVAVWCLAQTMPPRRPRRGGRPPAKESR